MSTHRPLPGVATPGRRALTLAVPAFLAAAGATLLLIPPGEEKVLLAWSPDPYQADVDGDGLIFHQEELLGTLDSELDTDFDGWDDLIELARNSDPLDAASTPQPALVDVGMTARTDGGVLTIVTAIYANFSQVPGLGFDMGFSLGGTTASIPAGLYLNKVKLHPGIDPVLGTMTGWIILIETPLPESLLAAYGGYIGFYFTVALKADTSTPVAAAVLNLFDWAGQTVMMEPAPSSLQSGSTYKPLGRGEDIPPTWTADQICWQQTSEVGVGSAAGTIELSIEDAGCEALDSYCNATQCANGIGTSVDVLDAGAFAGQE